MTTANAIRAGEAYVSIGARTDALRAGLAKAQARLREFGGTVQSIGSKLMGVGLGAAAGLGIGVKQFAEFESWMVRTKALANPTADEFEKLTQATLKVGQETAFTSADAAKTLALFAQSGLKVSEMLAAVGPSVDLAAAGMLDVATSADVSIKTMRGMGISATELGAVVDVLAKAMTTANTDVVQLGEAFRYVGPAARAAGVSLHEVTAAIQLLSDAGMQGEQAGSTLRGMILSLTSPSDKARQELRRLNIEINDAKGNFRGIAPVIGDLEKALSSMGSGARLDVLGSIFPDRQAMGSVNLILEGAAKLQKYTQALAGSSGTAARIATTQLDSLKGAWQILESSMESVLINVGSAVSPTLRAMAEPLTSLANATAVWAQKNAELWTTLTRVAVGSAAAGAAFLALGTAIKIGAFALGGFTIAAAAAKGAILLYMVNPLVVAAKWIASVGYTLGGMSATLGIAAVAAVALGGAMAVAKIAAIGYSVAMGVATVATAAYGAVAAVVASPMLAIAAAAGLVGTALVVTSATALGAFKGLGKGLSQIGDGIIGTFASIWRNAQSAIAGVREAIDDGDLEGAFKIAGLGIKAAWEELWAGLKAGTMNQLTLIGSNTVKIFVDVFGTVRKAWSHVAEFFGNSWDMLLVNLEMGWNNFAGFLKKSWANMQIRAMNPFASYDEVQAKIHAAEKEIDAETAQKNAPLEDAAAKKIAARMDAAKKARGDIDAETEGIKYEIDQDALREIRERNKLAAQAGAGTRAEIEMERWARAQRSMGPKLPSQEELDAAANRKLPKGLDKEVKKIGDGVAGAGGSADAQGTFNAAVASMLGGSSVSEQIRDHTRRTADATEKMAKKPNGIPVV
ncbi:MAG: phage tail tape measure protein [Desulfurellales bacterium]|nr:MAG: phage tail tape measure protein [Desulfurellales bacterium]